MLMSCCFPGNDVIKLQEVVSQRCNTSLSIHYFLWFVFLLMNTAAATMNTNGAEENMN